MPAFDRLSRVAGRAVDRLYGEEVSITGRIDSQYSGRTADPDRPAIKVRAVFADEPDADDIGGQRSGNSLPGVTRLTNGAVSIQIMAADVAAMLWLPRKGDLVRLSSRTGSPAYSVVDPRHLDHGDLHVILVREI
ncbi:hypothetical protein [Brucella anthropi]|uniref:hypothetical protein n=1 Tax=Brucella anthropi TaxID=529 RepID=UPI000F67A495|nr:hypothetical protein [Brucella anthropi]RRY08808.1 hypothetical protein EGJ58_12975 [Brucella anthropi]